MQVVARLIGDKLPI